MKKLVFLFIMLISLVVITGCTNSKKTVTRFTVEKDDIVATETKDTKAKTTTTKVGIGSKTESTTPVKTDTDNTVNKVKFAVTSLEKDVIESNKSYHLIQGTTPKTASKIEVNGYTLNKYKPGETEWSYIAATSLGTLKKGENNYTVRALDSKGKEIASESFTIVYNGLSSGILAPTGNNLNMALIVTIMGIFGFYGYGLRRKKVQI